MGKTNSERQTEYQKRRKETSERVTFWLGKDITAVVDRLRKDEPRQDWFHRAILLEMVRQLLDRPVPFSNAELARAARMGSEMQ